MDIKELDGYKRCSEEEYETDDDLAVAKIEFEDAVNTPIIYLKFKEDSD